MVHFDEFFIPEVCGQTVLTVMSILIGQKFMKNAKWRHKWRVFEDLKLVVKQFYQTGHFNRTKIAGKC